MPQSYFHGAEYLKVVKQGIAEGLTSGVLILQNEMKQNMGTGEDDSRGIVTAVRIRKTTRNASGKTRTVKARKNIYRSAAPGEFPGVRTGRLRNSISFAAASPTSLSAAAGSNLAYARYLEWGTYGSDGQQLMAPRPWAWRSLMLVKDEMVQKTVTTTATFIAKHGGVA